jgi:hypothetical protein
MDSINTNGDIRELDVLAGAQVSIKSDVVIKDNDTNDGSHGNTSMLVVDDMTMMLQGFGLSLKPAKRIIDTKRGGDTNLKLIDIQDSGDLVQLIRSKSNGRTSK